MADKTGHTAEIDTNHTCAPDRSERYEVSSDISARTGSQQDRSTMWELIPPVGLAEIGSHEPHGFVYRNNVDRREKHCLVRVGPACACRTKLRDQFIRRHILARQSLQFLPTAHTEILLIAAPCPPFRWAGTQSQSKQRSELHPDRTQEEPRDTGLDKVRPSNGAGIVGHIG